MKQVGFWDYAADLHLCPQEERREMCPHKLPSDHPERVEYVSTLQRERRAEYRIELPSRRNYDISELRLFVDVRSEASPEDAAPV